MRFPRWKPMLLGLAVADLTTATAVNAACPPTVQCSPDAVCPTGVAQVIGTANGDVYRVPCGCNYMLVKIWGGGGNSGAGGWTLPTGGPALGAAAVGTGGGGAAAKGVFAVVPNTFYKPLTAGEPANNSGVPGYASKFSDVDEATGCETEAALAVIGGGAGGGITSEGHYGVATYTWGPPYAVGDGGAAGRSGQNGKDPELLKTLDAGGSALITAGAGGGASPSSGGTGGTGYVNGHVGCAIGVSNADCVDGSGRSGGARAASGGQGAYGGGGGSIADNWGVLGAGGGGGSSSVFGALAFSIFDGEWRTPGNASDGDRGTPGTGPGYGGYLDGQPGHPATGTGVKGAGGKIVVRFSRTLDFGAGQTVPGVRSFNDDGKTDLILRDGALQHYIWYMDGTTRLSENAVSPNPPDLVSGADDFNGDGLADLVLHDPAAVPPTVEFWLMNGASRVGVPVPLSGATPLGGDWKVAATGDFDRDGSSDLVWRNTSTQKLRIWRLTGSPASTYASTIVPSPDQAVDSNWSIVAALDLGPGSAPDGNRDFLWYNDTSGKIVYWTMRYSNLTSECASQGLASPCLYRVTGAFTNPAAAQDANWKVVAGGDFLVGPAPGVSGSSDIVWRNDTTGRIVVWYMDFSGSRTSGQFTTPDAPSPTPTAWRVVGPK